MSDDRYMVGRRKEGATLEEIGGEIGITRQGVHSRLMRLYGTTKFTSFISGEQVARIAGLSPKSITSYRRKGVIQQVNTSCQHPLYDLGTIEIIRNNRKCGVCGGYIPSGKSRYCSRDCYLVSQKEGHKNCIWRNFHRKMGQPITPSIDYAKNKKVVAGV